MRNFKLEFAVGLFFIIGILAIIYLSVKVTSFNLDTKRGYTVRAVFDNVGGLKQNAKVEIAGVPVGVVQKIDLYDYRALVHLQIKKGVKIPDDSIASIKTKGMLGEKFLEISPGASDVYINPHEEIIDTQSPIDFEKALGKYIFGGVE